MRLIDADALLENFYKKRNPHEGADRTNQRHRYMQFLGDYEEIRNAPTIDAVPVIRCKDCKWWVDKTSYRSYPLCADYERSMNADDFCSRAERKEE